MDNIIDWGYNFQTPEYVCDYMASFLPNNAGYILEPTPGKGNLVKVLEQKGKVYAPNNFNDVNENSIVIKAQYDNISFLFEIKR